MQTFTNIAALAARIGQELGVSDWVVIDQARINAFAEATEDRQWIHVDVARAEKESPLGGPVAHGFLTLSLVPHLLAEIYRLDGISAQINYGLESVRFPAPVPAGSRLRARAMLEDLAERDGDRHLARLRITIEIEDSERPAAVVNMLMLYII